MMIAIEQAEEAILFDRKRLRLVWLDHYKGEVVSSMWWDSRRLKYVWILKKK
jgi:hypothetical protein